MISIPRLSNSHALEDAQRRYDRKEILWSEVQAVQARMMPGCRFCGSEYGAAAYIGDDPACADCFVTHYTAGRLS